MVLDLQNKPYDSDFLQDMEGIQLSLVQKYDLPFVTEGGRVYESYQELFQLELIQCGLLAEEDELIFKEIPNDFIFKQDSPSVQAAKTKMGDIRRGAKAAKAAVKPEFGEQSVEILLQKLQVTKVLMRERGQMPYQAPERGLRGRRGRRLERRLVGHRKP